MEDFAFWLKIANLILQATLASLFIYDWWHEETRQTAKGVGLVVGCLFCLSFAVYLVATHNND